MKCTRLNRREKLIMRAPSTAALLALASLCYDTTFCLAEAQQDPLKAKDKYKAACPAYEHYARSPQYARSFQYQVQSPY